MSDRLRSLVVTCFAHWACYTFVHAQTLLLRVTDMKSLFD